MIAKSFERIHRSNLVGMGIIPLCFKVTPPEMHAGSVAHRSVVLVFPQFSFAWSLQPPKPSQDVDLERDMLKSKDGVMRGVLPSRVRTRVCLAHFYPQAVYVYLSLDFCFVGFSQIYQGSVSVKTICGIITPSCCFLVNACDAHSRTPSSRVRSGYWMS